MFLGPASKSGPAAMGPRKTFTADWLWSVPTADFMQRNKAPLFDRLVRLQEWLRDGEVKRLRSLETPSFELRALFGIPGRARPVAVAARAIAGIAARAILVPVMLAGLSNIAAAPSDLALGKSVRHVGQR